MISPIATLAKTEVASLGPSLNEISFAGALAMTAVGRVVRCRRRQRASHMHVGKLTRQRDRAFSTEIQRKRVLKSWRESKGVAAF